MDILSSSFFLLFHFIQGKAGRWRDRGLLPGNWNWWGPHVLRNKSKKLPGFPLKISHKLCGRHSVCLDNKSGPHSSYLLSPYLLSPYLLSPYLLSSVFPTTSLPLWTTLSE